MEVATFGSGYVGLVTSTCLASTGNHVTCIDIDETRIANLKKGICPIHEPALPELLQKTAREGHLTFTTDAKFAIESSNVIFIAVGTPANSDGSANLAYVYEVAKIIGQHLNHYAVIVDKSTVPVGTADKVRAIIAEALKERDVDIPFDVASNPEFLKEGAAVEDFLKPSRIIIGTHSERAKNVLMELYAPFNRNRQKILTMNPKEAEFTKYTANAMLATKISFMNEMSQIIEHIGGIDIEKVRNGIGSDPRIGYQFIYPGCGYGGSCFPKDVRALAHTAQQHGYTADLLNAVEHINLLQKQLLFAKMAQHFNNDFKGKTFALWGLAFKPNTDDIREAPSRILMEALWEHGARVRAYDPAAMDAIASAYGTRDDLVLCDTVEETLEGAQALVVATEWFAFRNPDFVMLKKSLTQPVIFDGRNIYDPTVLKQHGFTYYGIGRSLEEPLRPVDTTLPETETT